MSEIFAHLTSASGYLISQLLSPDVNSRTDQYVGSLENRSDIIMEMTRKIQTRVLSSFVTGLNLNSVKLQDRGLNAEEGMQLCARLEANRIDFVELSGGDCQRPVFSRTLSYPHNY
jgi:2,4-dienoyl-CoA reductase-like NADH-dependent reductase (Old Yellow Enzyme family)